MPHFELKRQNKVTKTGFKIISTQIFNGFNASKYFTILEFLR